MPLTEDDVKKVAHLARLQINESEMPIHVKNLSNIMELIAQIEACDISDVNPMAHPLNATQVFREDKVTEVNLRDLYQSIAPAVESGLYLVPQVIEEVEE